MKYFVLDNQRINTNYHEFYKEKWDGNTNCKADSISLHDDFMCGDFEDAISDVIPAFYPFGETEITAEEWSEIGKVVLTKDKRAQDIYAEASDCFKEVFEQYKCFTIIRI